ncbi:MAG: hypothetical protein ACI9W4_000176 [Rhodothermales bacterium]
MLLLGGVQFFCGVLWLLIVVPKERLFQRKAAARE